MSATPLSLWLFLTFLLVSVSAQCYQRKEYRDLSDDEWNNFRSALLSLQNLPSTMRAGDSEWDDYANMHYQYSRQTHGTAMFLPWHRAFLLKLETRLRSLGPQYANVAIPYWSWSSDWQNPSASPIFQNGGYRNLYISYGGKKRGFGFRRPRSPRPPTRFPSPPTFPPPTFPAPPTTTNPPSANPSCLVTSHFPSYHCATRDYNPNRFGTYYSSEAMALMIIQQNSYAGFKQTIEGAPHGQVHNSIGGDMALMYSPNDPIFFLLHCSIDRMWWLWQGLDGSRKSASNAFSQSLNSQIPGFNYVVSDMTDTDNFCWNYADYSRDSHLTMSSLLAMQSSGAVDADVVNKPEDVTNCLPPQIPPDWITMNGLTEPEVRQLEENMRQVVARTKTSSKCASGASHLVQTIEETSENSTGVSGESQSLSVISSDSTVPAWGVVLLVLGVIIIVLMATLLLISMKTYSR